MRRLLETYDADKAAALWRLLARRGTWQCPTLVTRRRLWEEDRERLSEDDRRAGAEMTGRDSRRWPLAGAAYWV